MTQCQIWDEIGPLQYLLDLLNVQMLGEYRCGIIIIYIFNKMYIPLGLYKEDSLCLLVKEMRLNFKIQYISVLPTLK